MPNNDELNLVRLPPSSLPEIRKIKNWLSREYHNQRSQSVSDIIHPYRNWRSIESHLLMHGALVLKLKNFWAGIFLWERHSFHVIEVFYQYVALRFRRRGYATLFFNALKDMIADQPAFVYLRSTAEAVPYYLHNNWRPTILQGMSYRLNRVSFATPLSRCPSGAVLAFSPKSFYEVVSDRSIVAQKVYFQIDLTCNGLMNKPYAYRTQHENERQMHESYIALFYDHKVIEYADGRLAEGKASHFFKRIDTLYRMNYVVISQITVDDVVDDRSEVLDWVVAAMNGN